MKIKILIFALIWFGFLTSTSFTFAANVNDDYIAAPKIERAQRSIDKNPSVIDQRLGTKQDIEVTRLIRKNLNKEKNLSTAAKNIEVITLDNVITLRGTVKNQEEMQKVFGIANKIAGNRSVKNELVINPTKKF